MNISIIGKKSLPAIFVYSGFLATLAMAESNPVVWTAPNLHRVSMTEAAGNSNQVNLEAARGEYESFQIVTNGSSNGLSNVNVTVSDLKGPGGQVIPQSNFTLYREKYMQVTSSSPNRGSNHPLPPGWYPDALIPFTDPATGKPPVNATLKAAPFDVKAGNNQPIWVDLLVPRGATAGEYTGSYTVTSSQGNTTGEIKLKVWNFTLPTAPALKSSFLFFQEGSLAAQKELLRNKLMPSNVHPSNQAAMKEAGLNATNTGPFSGADIGRCGMSPAPSAAQFKSLAAAHQQDLLLYDYSADEIGHCKNLYPMLKQWGANMHQAGIKNLVSMSPTPDLFTDGTNSGRSAVDIWVVLPVMYNNSKGNIEQALKKGDAVWSYNTLVQDDYSPKWEIDFDPVNFRVQPGFINQSLNLTGLLYWRVDRWSNDPWNNINNAGAFASANYPGEGALVYPGKQVGVQGVVASMRMKWLRDGVEDYDYVQILKDLGKSDLALQISRSVGPDWVHWTRDANAIESARHKLGEAINEAMNQRAATTSAVGQQ